MSDPKYFHFPAEETSNSGNKLQASFRQTVVVTNGSIKYIKTNLVLETVTLCLSISTQTGRYFLLSLVREKTLPEKNYMKWHIDLEPVCIRDHVNQVNRLTE